MISNCAMRILATALLAAAVVRGPVTTLCSEPAEPPRARFADVDDEGRVRLDRARPVPAKSDVLAAWRKRQDAITSFRVAWTEDQCRPKGWIANPRYPQREWLAIPTLLVDRPYTVSKTLEVDGLRMRYGFAIDRAGEPDGIEVKFSTGDNRGLGVRRPYSYTSVFDGRRGEFEFSSLTGSPPPSASRTDSNVDAQELTLRPFLLAFRPLAGAMGDLLLDRAVTNGQRTIYRGQSTFLLEERHDPSGWKTIRWIEPERDFIVTRLAVVFEQKAIVDVDIDYRRDPKWGWVPSGWRVVGMTSDHTRRVVARATVSAYGINVPFDASRFSLQ